MESRAAVVVVAQLVLTSLSDVELQCRIVVEVPGYKYYILLLSPPLTCCDPLGLRTQIGPPRGADHPIYTTARRRRQRRWRRRRGLQVALSGLGGGGGGGMTPKEREKAALSLSLSLFPQPLVAAGARTRYYYYIAWMDGYRPPPPPPPFLPHGAGGGGVKAARAPFLAIIGSLGCALWIGRKRGRGADVLNEKKVGGGTRTRARCFVHKYYYSTRILVVLFLAPSADRGASWLTMLVKTTTTTVLKTMIIIEVETLNFF